MNRLKIFKNDSFGLVRTLEINGEPWFVGKDVAEALGYSNPRKAIGDHVDDEDKGVTKCDTLGGSQDLTVINESGLYSLILSSKLPTAKAFKRWVTSEVLPAIRKHGLYATEELIANPDLAIEAFKALKEEREARKALEAENKQMQPLALFAKSVSASHTSILIGELAKLIKQNGVNIGQTRLFAWLRDEGYLMKSGSSRNMPTQRSMEQGLFEIKESSYINSEGVTVVTKTTKVTGKGQIYFVNKFLCK
nr:phage antirepressor KilAC domain-containing protein [uncultured Lachnoanaerobaculum sp.]